MFFPPILRRKDFKTPAFLFSPFVCATRHFCYDTHPVLQGFLLKRSRTDEHTMSTKRGGKEGTGRRFTPSYFKLLDKIILILLFACVPCTLIMLMGHFVKRAEESGIVRGKVAIRLWASYGVLGE